MSPIFDALPLGEYAAQDYARRFVRTPMGLYFDRGPKQSAPRVNEDEAAEWIAEARLRLEEAEAMRPKFRWSAIFPIIGALVVAITALSMLSLGMLIGPVVFMILFGPSIVGAAHIWFVWQRILAETNEKLAERATAEAAHIAAHVTRNPFASWLPTCIIIALSVIVGLRVAEGMLDDDDAAALRLSTELVTWTLGTAVILLVLAALTWDRAQRLR